MKRPRFSIYTLGCKTNQSESEKILTELISLGYDLVGDDEYPEIFILNTCTVTSKSDAKARQLIRQIKKKYPSSELIVTGCFINFNKTFLLENNVSNYFSNKEKENITHYLKDKYGSFDIKDTESGFHSRIFIKVQDGCQQNCSYCIVPLVRGKYISTPINQVLSQIKEKISEGYEEIVLTGIHIGKYGIELIDDMDLKRLISQILEKTEIKRLRLSSLEINEIDEGMINLLNNERIARHLHIPLQSGSNKVLKIMKRPYDSSFFLEKIKNIKAVLNEFAITTDIIVGHPFEEEKDFMDTVKICEDVFFSKMHIFKYSKRALTDSSIMPNQVNETVKAKRSRVLRELGSTMRISYVKDFVGKEMDVLTEQKNDAANLVSSTSSNYIKVFFPIKYGTKFAAKGKIAKVRTYQNKDDILYADLI